MTEEQFNTLNQRAAVLRGIVCAAHDEAQIAYDETRAICPLFIFKRQRAIDRCQAALDLSKAAQGQLTRIVAEMEGLVDGDETEAV